MIHRLLQQKSNLQGAPKKVTPRKNFISLKL